MPSMQELAARAFTVWANLDQQVRQLNAYKNRQYQLWVELDKLSQDSQPTTELPTKEVHSDVQESLFPQAVWISSITQTIQQLQQSAQNFTGLGHVELRLTSVDLLVVSRLIDSIAAQAVELETTLLSISASLGIALSVEQAPAKSQSQRCNNFIFTDEVGPNAPRCALKKGHAGFCLDAVSFIKEASK